MDSREWEKELLKLKVEFKLGSDGKKKATKKPSLLWALVRVFWLPYTIDGVLCFLQLMLFRILQPIFQRFVINYFGTEENQTTRNEALISAGGLTLATFGVVLTIHHGRLRSMRVGMRVKAACCSLIYRKVNKLYCITLEST